MIRNDQIYISVKLKTINGTTETVLTPDNVDDVKITIGCGDAMYTKQYSKEELIWDSTNSKWLFFVDEDISNDFNGKYSIQAEYKISGTPDQWRHFDMQTRYVGKNIMPRGWD